MNHLSQDLSTRARYRCLAFWSTQGMRRLISLLHDHKELQAFPRVLELDVVGPQYDVDHLLLAERLLFGQLPRLEDFRLKNAVSGCLVQAVARKPLRVLHLHVSRPHNISPILHLPLFPTLRELRITPTLELEPDDEARYTPHELGYDSQDTEEIVWPYEYDEATGLYRRPMTSLDELPPLQMSHLHQLHWHSPVPRLLGGGFPALRHIALVGVLEEHLFPDDMPLAPLFTSGQLDTAAFSMTYRVAGLDWQWLPGFRERFAAVRARVIEINFVPIGVTVLDLHEDVEVLVMAFPDETWVNYWSSSLDNFVPSFTLHASRRRNRPLSLLFPPETLGAFLDRSARLACEGFNVTLGYFEGPPPSTADLSVT
jgi:hypothetical protein